MCMREGEIGETVRRSQFVDFTLNLGGNLSDSTDLNGRVDIVALKDWGKEEKWSGRIYTLLRDFRRRRGHCDQYGGLYWGHKREH